VLTKNQVERAGSGDVERSRSLGRIRLPRRTCPRPATATGRTFIQGTWASETIRNSERCRDVNRPARNAISKTARWGKRACQFTSNRSPYVRTGQVFHASHLPAGAANPTPACALRSSRPSRLVPVADGFKSGLCGPSGRRDRRGRVGTQALSQRACVAGGAEVLVWDL